MNPWIRDVWLPRPQHYNPFSRNSGPEEANEMIGHTANEDERPSRRSAFDPDDDEDRAEQEEDRKEYERELCRREERQLRNEMWERGHR